MNNISDVRWGINFEWSINCKKFYIRIIDSFKFIIPWAYWRKHKRLTLTEIKWWINCINKYCLFVFYWSYKLIVKLKPIRLLQKWNRNYFCIYVKQTIVRYSWTDESEKSILHLTWIMSQSFDDNTYGLHGWDVTTIMISLFTKEKIWDSKYYYSNPSFFFLFFVINMFTYYHAKGT